MRIITFSPQSLQTVGCMFALRIALYHPLQEHHCLLPFQLHPLPQAQPTQFVISIFIVRIHFDCLPEAVDPLLHLSHLRKSISQVVVLHCSWFNWDCFAVAPDCLLKLSGCVKCIPQVVVGIWVVGVYLDCLPAALDCLLVLLDVVKCTSKVAVGLWEVGVYFDCFFVVIDCLSKSPLTMLLISLYFLLLCSFFVWGG